ncbi:MAG: methylated-DNA--[protein]-cysteine S-methyltransferase [Coriobacteriales bacterium]|jgi:methylated-DNA-[protein]-cysteine S-methyltransferase|nr:methylated-DNA--[protein]-cysteine S-methyltransferase [Coriobacteriales bacterium]
MVLDDFIGERTQNVSSTVKVSERLLYYNKAMEAIYYATYPTPLGTVLVTAKPTAITGLWFTERQRHQPAEELFEGWTEAFEHPLLLAAKDWLDAYFAGSQPAVELPLELAGSPFQQAVWRLLTDIPYGSTSTYRELALLVQASQQRLRTPAAQAIGGAVGRNPISLIVPCHRVIGSNGNLVGYGGGLDRKLALLKLEGVL